MAEIGRKMNLMELSKSVQVENADFAEKLGDALEQKSEKNEVVSKYGRMSEDEKSRFADEDVRRSNGILLEAEAKIAEMLGYLGKMQDRWMKGVKGDLENSVNSYSENMWKAQGRVTGERKDEGEILGEVYGRFKVCVTMQNGEINFDLPYLVYNNYPIDGIVDSRSYDVNKLKTISVLAWTEFYNNANVKISGLYVCANSYSKEYRYYVDVKTDNGIIYRMIYEFKNNKYIYHPLTLISQTQFVQCPASPIGYSIDLETYFDKDVGIGLSQDYYVKEE